MLDMDRTIMQMSAWGHVGIQTTSHTNATDLTRYLTHIIQYNFLGLGFWSLCLAIATQLYRVFVRELIIDMDRLLKLSSAQTEQKVG